MGTNFNIVEDFFNSAQRYPQNTALVCGKQNISYEQLRRSAGKLASLMKPVVCGGRVGILGSRSIDAYIGIIAAAAAGATYVPLNLKWPEQRLTDIMTRLDLDALVVDKLGADRLSSPVMEVAPQLIIASDYAAAVAGAIRFSEIDAPELDKPVQRSAGDIAYIMHTSGSTGTPKGVEIHCSGLRHYLDQVAKWACFTQDDKIAEAHDITFDLSVHNMFLAWRAGSCQYLMSSLDMMAPQAFIRRHGITAWMSVPTLVNNLRRAGKLSSGLLPSLRLSVFCGEPLSVNTIEAWADAAPNSVIENIYGPTEVTVTVTRQRYTNPPLITPQRGILAIGQPFDGTTVRICDEAGNTVPDNQVGEIVLSGPQLGVGYFQSQAQTDAAFRTVEGERRYFTGDLGYRDHNGIFHHMGRLDNQIKMKGNRIELEEVETHLRRVCETELASVVAWPYIDGIPQGLVGFTTSTGKDEKQIRVAMMRDLPEYMVPAKIIIRDDLPRNANDKIDRKALRAMLDAPAIDGPDVPAKVSNRAGASAA